MSVIRRVIPVLAAGTFGLVLVAAPAGATEAATPPQDAQGVERISAEYPHKDGLFGNKKRCVAAGEAGILAKKWIAYKCKPEGQNYRLWYRTKDDI
ncbi:hypothetical protein [Saccharothrix australiensis]|uniref:Uncharacterized protein n=1 Tax=Saccharothrix australiensis TaxID=2072 RepID=A0A495W9H4_9PSEU|nr:hypothetical protein [Saccharothrix australiensis]RKT56448.1 hypothetical protein C8E97_5147 [Saccharothrix australiensis]